MNLARAAILGVAAFVLAGASPGPSASPKAPKSEQKSEQKSAQKPSQKSKQATPKTSTEKIADKPVAQMETYKDLVQKAQNLTLQRDRLQTSQVLVRGLHREPRGSVAFKELSRTLDELASVFYTEKAQSSFVAGDSILENKPKEAIEHFQEALKSEDGNLSVLKSLARAHLLNGDCARADTSTKAAEGIHPFSAEVKLLRLQVLECSRSYEMLSSKLSDPDLEAVDKFVKGIAMRDLMRRSELKKARALLANWETQAADYPEIQYWKWEISNQGGIVDRAAAVKYLQACQNLTPRRRKSYILDVDLCKGKEAVEAYVKETGLRSGTPAEPEDD